MARTKRNNELAQHSCYYCEKPVGSDYFCFGCKQYICDDCDPGDLALIPTGEHTVEAHKEAKQLEEEQR